METLFRLLLQRPAVAPDEQLPGIQLTYGPTFQAAIKKSVDANNGRLRLSGLKQSARAFVAGNEFVGAASGLEIADKLRALGDRLDTLEARKTLTNEDVTKAIEGAFGSQPASLVNDKEVTSAVARLTDSIIAIKLLPQEHDRPLESLVKQLRDLEVIVKVATSGDFPADAKTLHRYRRRALVLPGRYDRHSSLSTREWQDAQEKLHQEAQAAVAERTASALQRYRELSTAVAELTSLDSSYLQTTPQPPAPDSAGETATPARSAATAASALQQVERTQAVLNNARNLIAKGGLDKEGIAKLQAKVKSTMADTSAIAEAAGKAGGRQARAIQKAASQAGFRLKASATEALSPITRQVLKQHKLAVDAHPLDRLATELRSEKRELASELDTLYRVPPQIAMRRIGRTLVATVVPEAPIWHTTLKSDTAVMEASSAARPLLPPVHQTALQAPQMADLLVVKQRLVRYEGADLSHIENILKSEKKEREHTTRRETEELIFRETEATDSEERDLESTSRYEMSRATSDTLAEDTNLSAGLNVSGKYGPAVEFSASAEGSTSRSKSAATDTAASYSQDVTERSAKKVSQRVLERTSLRTTAEEIERSLHGFDNTDGSGHISGIYQWVNKVYRAQMYNYGKRAMYDFMVPEPAAFLISVQENDHAGMVNLHKPPVFRLEPAQITEANYGYWIRVYGATDVEPPPGEYRTKSVAFDSGTKNASEGSEERVNYTHSADIQIDEGYRAIAGFATCPRIPWSWNDQAASVIVQIGRRAFPFWPGTSFMSLDLDNESGLIPFAISSDGITSFTLAAEIQCQRTPRAVEKWQHGTHAKLTQAYKARLAEYEEKFSELEARAGSTVHGHNPALNMQLMRDELKKHCISILTQQHFEAFGAIESYTESGLRQTNLTQAALEGPYVRFFEQAFEWEQMTWKTYPYFWGGKKRWQDRVSYEDDDPTFNQFLKAGYARVVVPARPGFEHAIEHFKRFGELWNGGPLPAIGDELYLPVADEIAEELDRPSDDAQPQGESWEVVVPTTLVHLRADDKLPRWDPESGEEIVN